VVRVKRVMSAKMSPDGRHIAYTLSVPRPLNDDEAKGGAPYSELHVIERSTGRSRPFIAGKVNIGNVKWAPDGQISFTAKRGDDKETSLYVIPVDGGEARKVVSHPTGIGDYDWRPDGTQVCFIAREKEPKELKKARDRGFNQEIFEEDWRPSFVWIADVADPANDKKIVGDGGFRADGDNKDDSTGKADDDKSKEKYKARKIDLEGSALRARWRPDGQQLAVVVAANPGIDAEYMFARIRIVDAESGKIVEKVENPGKLEQLQWSPDGRRLACISAADPNDPSAGRLMVATFPGGALTDVVPNIEGDVRDFEWQDDNQILYIADVGVQTRLCEVDVASAKSKTIIDLPAGQPVLGAISLSRDGQHGAFTASTPRHPPEVYSMSHGDAGPMRLTNSNPWIDQMQMAPQEVVEYTARDGLKLQGILIRPLNEQEGTKYPLVMCVHGGPEAHVSNGWVTRYSEPGQLLAQEGYAVFYPNYRGSTGRGVAFSKLSQGDAAGKEFDDLVDAIEHFVKTGLVDRARVGVTGGSYGGYATAWCSTKLTEHFAAGVMFVGISDMVAKSGTTDIPTEERMVHALQWPWEDWEKHRERSPVTYAPQARTPLLIMHGKDDPRVHPSQSLILYRYLKNVGKVPVRLVWYPGEGHGNRRVASQYDYCLRMVQWMDHYLNPEHNRTTPPPPYELDYEPKKAEATKDPAATGGKG
jgi:dipeptidyl aminopeptidase/acylaminoacyl peptidase